MIAEATTLLKFLKNSTQFIIPIYQRNYSWTNKQCDQLWDDILRAGEDDKIHAHFIGSIVYVERALSTVSSQESLLVIDGQQRLTTCTLLISALADFFEKNNISELLSVFSAKKLRNYYLTNPEEEGDRHFKLILSETDKDTLLSILKNTPEPEKISIRIKQNYEQFQKLTLENKDKLEIICRGLDKLIIVEVALDRVNDNPQLIFESMNSTGLELSQADLIRNYILMGLEPALQNELYNNYWRKMEQLFGQEAYNQYFDDFMRHYLTTKTGYIPNIRQVYNEFKRFSHSTFPNDIKGLVNDIYTYAGYYCAFALNKENDPTLKQAFTDLRELKVEVAYPVLLDAYHAYKKHNINHEELCQIVRLIESYVFRRSVCDIPTNSLNKTFAALAKNLDKEHYLENLQVQLLTLPSYRRFPSDEEFLQEIKIRDSYNFARRVYLLRKLENYGRKEIVNVNDYTIEHILPQNPKLSAEWKAELGENWEKVQQTYLHTLGNLTLTAYNSEYSDHPFTYKRNSVQDKEGNLIGLAHSPLKLNEHLGQTWNENEIKTRANRLAERAIKIWSRPHLTLEQIAQYKPSEQSNENVYSIDDHPNLLPNSPMHHLFQLLRKQILMLDKCVNEEFLKLYVAYKAETNFVDLIPQTRKLCLVLNMRFADIQDPRGLCRDVTNIGKWGNGDVEISLNNIDDIPYVMGLIRQSFDYQMLRS